MKILFALLIFCIFAPSTSFYEVNSEIRINPGWGYPQGRPTLLYSYRLVDTSGFIYFIKPYFMSTSQNFEAAYAQLREYFDEPISQSLAMDLCQIQNGILQAASVNQFEVDFDIASASFNLLKVIEFFKQIELKN